MIVCSLVGMADDGLIRLVVTGKQACAEPRVDRFSDLCVPKVRPKKQAIQEAGLGMFTGLCVPKDCPKKQAI